MTDPAGPLPPLAPPERRQERRGHFHVARDVVFGALRAALRVVNDFRVAVGLVVVAGMVVAVVGTAAFVTLANHVNLGRTQPFDEAVLRWMGAHRIPWLETSLLEFTALGNGLVTVVVVGVAALFLALTRQRYPALLLVAATAGGLVINGVLKHAFHRPRPAIFAAGARVLTTSFPSGHAMGSTVVYTTIAYLAIRLQPPGWQRWLTTAVATLLIATICLSRLYLGVHYPSDVLAGVAVGLAWSALCMTALEAIQLAARRRAAAIVDRALAEHPPAR